MSITLTLLQYVSYRLTTKSEKRRKKTIVYDIVNTNKARKQASFSGFEDSPRTWEIIQVFLANGVEALQWPEPKLLGITEENMG